MVNVGRHDSTMSAITRGVPQGSILGPLLFVIFTNEMSTVVNMENCENPAHQKKSQIFGENCEDCGMLVNYADDATYVVANKHRQLNQLKINQVIKKLETYLNDNELAINVGKTALLEAMIKQKKGRTPGDPPPPLRCPNQSKYH